jgi:hypothetical protein
MKTFEQVSSTTGSQRDDVKSMPEKMNSNPRGVKSECRHPSPANPPRPKLPPISSR